jgi:hypothetical protein
VAWLLLWYLVDPNIGGRATSLLMLIIVGFTAVLLGVVSWAWKHQLTEMIEDHESEEEWKAIQSERWPPVER